MQHNDVKSCVRVQSFYQIATRVTTRILMACPVSRRAKTGRLNALEQRNQLKLSHSTSKNAIDLAGQKAGTMSSELRAVTNSRSRMAKCSSSKTLHRFSGPKHVHWSRTFRSQKTCSFGHKSFFLMMAWRRASVYQYFAICTPCLLHSKQSSWRRQTWCCGGWTLHIRNIKG